MGIRAFWKESILAFIFRRILYAILMGIVITVFILYFLKSYTKHGEAVAVPDLKGLYVEEAQKLLVANDLYIEVIDSVYVHDKPLATIIEQVPSTKSVVKKNRAIFVIVNKKLVKRVPMPEINDLSYRQAVALISSLGLNVANVVYQPSEYKDLVIDAMIDSIRISPGTKLADGTYLTLVVGSGLGNENSSIPSLIGLGVEEGRQLAVSNSFVIGARNIEEVHYNDRKLLIYKQKPEPGESLPTGTRIDIWLTDDEGILEDAKNQDLNDKSEEEFF